MKKGRLSSVGIVRRGTRKSWQKNAKWSSSISHPNITWAHEYHKQRQRLFFHQGAMARRGTVSSSAYPDAEAFQRRRPPSQPLFAGARGQAWELIAWRFTLSPGKFCVAGAERAVPRRRKGPNPKRGSNRRSATRPRQKSAAGARSHKAPWLDE